MVPRKQSAAARYLGARNDLLEVQTERARLEELLADLQALQTPQWAHHRLRHPHGHVPLVAPTEALPEPPKGHRPVKRKLTTRDILLWIAGIVEPALFLYAIFAYMPILNR